MMRRSLAKPKAGTKAAAHEDVEHASAQRAVYDGDQDRVTLSGSVTMSDAGSGLWADQGCPRSQDRQNAARDWRREDEDYVQDPAVATRAGGGSDQPTHILADRAELQHATKIAIFYGKPVRMWQGGNQVLAPVIEVAQAEKRLTARGDGSAAAQVHTVLTAGAGDVPGKGGGFAGRLWLPR